MSNFSGVFRKLRKWSLDRSYCVAPAWSRCTRHVITATPVTVRSECARRRTVKLKRTTVGNGDCILAIVRNDGKRARKRHRDWPFWCFIFASYGFDVLRYLRITFCPCNNWNFGSLEVEFVSEIGNGGWEGARKSRKIRLRVSDRL